MIKSIVITGVSTGIGYGIAKKLIKKGYRVFGSVRRTEDAERLINEFGSNYVPLIFDVTDQESIQEAAKLVKKEIGDRSLSGLINNAGSTEGGPLMHYPLNTFRQQFEVLVTGQLAVTQAFLPLLGAGNKDCTTPGRIIMISSTSGKSGFPFMGPYASSKHALEGLSKSLRAEMLIYGIDVIVIGPGNVKTDIWGKNKPETVELYKDTDFYTPMMNMYKYIQDLIPKDSLDLDVFCRKVVRIFEKKRPKVRYTIVRKPIRRWIITNIIPEKIKNRVVSRILGMK